MIFSLILFILSLLTGLLWCPNVFVFKKQRAPDAKDPVWVAWGADFFGVIVFVFLLRSFIAEPFRIPSGSMTPTLLGNPSLFSSDFILVNKFAYGIRLPIINKKIFSVADPKRGETFVFRYPADPSLDYIKRVVGIPGDVISYQNKRLTINGEPLPMKKLPDFTHASFASAQFEETLGGISHRILNDEHMPTVDLSQVHDFPLKKMCRYSPTGFTCTVPNGHYFAMGDNRDQSSDSRYWGFVPEENLVGKAFFIWLNFSDLSRIGSFQ